ncbi:formyltransferase family protein [Thalassospiraceae bacterium LMO-JJ14]|nr:formyltransferase family protein [Thalassospiraceae bacterium LMO-JJ14]
MPERIILLTGEVEAPHLSGMLRQHNPSLDVVPAFDKDALLSAVNAGLHGVRLIAFLTSVIVPKAVLAALEGPAYNFHPGPPEYPGSYVAGFAVYDGARTFGVTLHEMADKVDTGPIVEVRRFPVPDGAKFQELEIEAFKQVLQLFADYAPHMATNDEPLPSGVEPWTGVARTRAEAERLQEIEADLSEEEIVRRYRAFG